MKLLLTGATGFIGRHLVEQLSLNHTILSPTHKQLDLTEETAVELYFLTNTFDVIIHSACQETTHCLEDNLRMFFNINKYRGSRKMIYFGSGAEFDRNHWITNMREDYFDTFIPQDQYGFSKYLMNYYMNKVYTNNMYNLRLFGVFGKYEDKARRFISHCLTSEHIYINDNIKFDYLYIDDLVRIVDWFITHSPFLRDYNICSGITHKLSEIADMIKEIKTTPFSYEIIKDSEKHYGGDNSRFLKETAFQFTPLPQAIRELYAYYKTV